MLPEPPGASSASVKTGALNASTRTVPIIQIRLRILFPFLVAARTERNVCISRQLRGLRCPDLRKSGVSRDGRERLGPKIRVGIRDCIGALITQSPSLTVAQKHSQQSVFPLKVQPISS